MQRAKALALLFGALTLAVVVTNSVAQAQAQGTAPAAGHEHGRDQPADVGGGDDGSAPEKNDGEHSPDHPVEPEPESKVPAAGADETDATASAHTEQEADPSLPDGMTLDQVLARAAAPPPDSFPDAINDDRLLAFLLVDQLEYRVDGKADPDVLAWEANAWIGGDFNRLVLKPEGEATFEKKRSLETDTDVLYGRLFAPFWSVQIGGQYANQWDESKGYRDRWSGAIALQGLAPGKFEVDLSAYVSDKGHFTSKLELEYDWRITQRLVVQPRTELTVAFQDIPDRNMGAGLATVVGGLRVRYEFKREFAPYVGIRYQASVFESADRARAAGEEPARFFVLAGLRLAFL